MAIPDDLYNAERGFQAMLELSRSAEENGLSDMSLDEIDAEIEAVRNERYTVAQTVEEVKATMVMSGLPLTDKELLVLTEYAEGRISADELRQAILDDRKLGGGYTEE